MIGYILQVSYAVQDLTIDLSIHNQISTALSDAYFATSCPSIFWGCCSISLISRPTFTLYATKGSATSVSAQTAPNIYNPSSNILKSRGTDPFSMVALIQYTSLNHVTRSGGLLCPAPGERSPRDHGILYGLGNSNSVLNYQYIERGNE